MKRTAPDLVHLLVAAERDAPGFRIFGAVFACGAANTNGTYGVLGLNYVTCADCRATAESVEAKAS